MDETDDFMGWLDAAIQGSYGPKSKAKSTRIKPKDYGKDVAEAEARKEYTKNPWLDQKIDMDQDLYKQIIKTIKENEDQLKANEKYKTTIDVRKDRNTDHVTKEYKYRQRDMPLTSEYIYPEVTRNEIEPEPPVKSISDRDLMNELFNRGLIKEMSSDPILISQTKNQEKVVWEANLRRQAVSKATTEIHKAGGNEPLFQLVVDHDRETVRAAVYVCVIPKKV